MTHLATLSPEADLVGLLAGHRDEVEVALVVNALEFLLLSPLPRHATTPHQLDELGRLVLLLVLELEARDPIHHLIIAPSPPPSREPKRSDGREGGKGWAARANRCCWGSV